MMELGEKIQALRKRRGLTQEELAGALYVSRAAVSKWESGRGYPSIDSLKTIADFFAMTIDELLSDSGVVEEANKSQKEHRLPLLFGLLDLSSAALFFLPLFRQEQEMQIRAVTLLSLTGVQPYWRLACLAIIIGMIMVGVFTLVFQNMRGARKFSLAVNAMGAALLAASLHPYAALFLFALLMIKGFLLVKKQ